MYTLQQLASWFLGVILKLERAVTTRGERPASDATLAMTAPLERIEVFDEASVPSLGYREPAMEFEPEPEPEPEPQPEPEQAHHGMLLDATIVVLVSSEDGVSVERPMNYHELVLMMRTRQITGLDRVFAPPQAVCAAPGIPHVIGDLIGMDAVEAMSDGDELAYVLWEQLTPTPVVAAVEVVLAERAASRGVPAGCWGTDELGRACAEIAPPLSLCSAGFLRAPVALLPALAQAAARELGETPSARDIALGQLRRKMQVLERDGVPSGSPGIGAAIAFGRTDDQFLVAFLRANKYAVTEALQAIVRYTRFVDEHADWLGEPMLQDETTLARLLGVYVATGTTRCGQRVLLLKWSQLSEKLLRRVEPDQHSEPLYRVMVRLLFGTLGRLLSDAHAQVLGVTLIHDWESPPPTALIMRINSTLSNVQKRSLLSLVREVLPLRQVGLLALNQPWWLTMMMATRTSSMKGDAGGWFPYLPERISYEQLHGIIDPASLPVAFRGAQAWRPPPDPEDQQIHVSELQMQQSLFTELLQEMEDEALSAKLSAIKAELSKIMSNSDEEPSIRSKRGSTLEELGVPAGRIHLNLTGPGAGVQLGEDQPCALQ